MVRMRTLAFLLVALIIGAGSAMADVVYDAEITGMYVVPPSECDGYGQATMIVNTERTQAYLTLNFAGLDTPQTGAVLLAGAADEAGTVLMELPMGSPLALTVEYTTELAEAVENEMLAVQIASESCPDGAIRGNFVFVTVGTEAQSWTQVKTLFE
jgi:hypothetical protein